MNLYSTLVRTTFQFEYLIDLGIKMKYYKTFGRNLTKLALVDRRLCGSGAQTTRNLILIFFSSTSTEAILSDSITGEERYQSYYM